MKTIPLTKGYFAIVDDEDFELVSGRSWYAHIYRHADGTVAAVYARAWLNNRQVLMHRLILGIHDSKIHIDHADHDGRNNRRSNLRVCTLSQNQGNRRIGKNNTSSFKGVHREYGKWVAIIGGDKNRRRLGVFDNPEDAAKAYAKAAAERYGQFSNL